MASEEKWKSRRFTLTGGTDGQIRTEERVYQVDDADAVTWHSLLGKTNPDYPTLHCTQIDIDRHGQGGRAIIRETYSTSGLGVGRTELDQFIWSIRPASTRKRTNVTCPSGGESLERDIIHPRVNLRVLSWHAKPKAWYMANWATRVNKNAHDIGGVWQVPAGTLLFMGGSISQVGENRWRHEWSWMFDWDRWTTKCLTHGVTINLYPALDMGMVLNKLILTAGDE